MSTQPERSDRANDTPPTDGVFNSRIRFLKGVAETVHPMFRLGDGLHQDDVLVNNHRILTWELKGNEKDMAAVAGWDHLNYNLDDSPRGYIVLPEGTRNAQSFLSGVEAVAGEKTMVVRFAIDYLTGSKELTGNFDKNFSWKQVGVTPDHLVFIVPPNNVPTEGEVSDAEWLEATTQELEALLANDEANSHLVADFRSRLGST